jgi:hypothetical protein
MSSRLSPLLVAEVANVDVQHVGRQAFGGQFEGGARAGAGLEEQVDDGGARAAAGLS